MPLQSKSRKFKISCARNLRTGTVKWDWIVNTGLLNRLRSSGEWRLTGVAEYDGIEQTTLES
jgi:hypothetical protein